VQRNPDVHLDKTSVVIGHVQALFGHLLQLDARDIQQPLMDEELMAQEVDSI